VDEPAVSGLEKDELWLRVTGAMGVVETGSFCLKMVYLAFACFGRHLLLLCDIVSCRL
jgi:hypothetical protein